MKTFSRFGEGVGGEETLKAKTLMVQGTTSYSGKSSLVAALCRLFTEAGYKVAPFKAQNMSLNSFITLDGAEISRAQALQAFAAGVEPTADMNPILLKPKGDMTSQVIFHGKPYRDMRASEYYLEFALSEGVRGVAEALARLRAEHELVLIEGAGSPAEINLYELEIANMRTAEMAEAPVIIIADIDRGGAFASILGTWKLLRPRHRRRVKGFIINKFRGDVDILRSGLTRLEQLTGEPILGVLPYVRQLKLPGEDSISLDDTFSPPQAQIDIVAVRFTRISNFTDLDPLIFQGGVRVRFVESREELGKPDAVILPGTKNTVRDLLWMRRQGISEEVVRLAEEGIPVIGICGGYQMLGKTIKDRRGVEGGTPQDLEGLGLLDTITVFKGYDKVTNQVKVQVMGGGPLLDLVRGREFTGYEIHMGKTRLGKDAKPIFRITQSRGRGVNRLEGATERSGMILGSYIHGIFDNPPLRKALIGYISRCKGIEVTGSEESMWDLWSRSLERLVQIVEENLDVDKLCEIVGLPRLRV